MDGDVMMPPAVGAGVLMARMIVGMGVRGAVRVGVGVDVRLNGLHAGAVGVVMHVITGRRVVVVVALAVAVRFLVIMRVDMTRAVGMHMLVLVPMHRVGGGGSDQTDGLRRRGLEGLYAEALHVAASTIETHIRSLR
jgi:hypothetical protein